MMIKKKLNIATVITYMYILAKFWKMFSDLKKLNMRKMWKTDKSLLKGGKKNALLTGLVDEKQITTLPKSPVRI